MKQWFEEKNAPVAGTPLCQLDQLSPGAVKEFEFGDSIKTRFRMFLYRSDTSVLAYMNRCPHFNVPLNINSGDLFTSDNSQFQCCHHYATFDKLSGECTDGPCEGRQLTRIPVRIADDLIVIAGDVS